MDGTSSDTRSLYRVHRPQTFSELRGQGHVARTLTNAVRAGTVAHGYVFAGPRGTGKTSTARILAKALNCMGPDDDHRLVSPTPDPCGVCDSCRQIAGGASIDVIEMDAASHTGVEDIRELRDTVAFTPVRDRYKVYIIDEAHMLSRAAFNALLKTLEEPPANVVFVLATTEPHKLPDTIVSRCQRFDFHRPSMEQIVDLLTAIATHEGVEIDSEALETIAEHSQGGFRDAIGALDRLRSFADGRIRADDVLTVLGVTDTQLLSEVTDIVIDRDPAAALAFVHRLYERGVNYSQFIADLLRHLRRLFLLQNLTRPGEDPALLRALGQNVGLHAAAIARLQPQAHQFTPAALVRFMDLLGHAQTEIKAGLDGRLQLELALVRLTRPQADLSLEGLDQRLRRLEEAVHAGAVGPGHGSAERPPKTAAAAMTASATSGSGAPSPGAEELASPGGRRAVGGQDRPGRGTDEPSPARPAAAAPSPSEPEPSHARPPSAAAQTTAAPTSAGPEQTPPTPPEAGGSSLERVTRAWPLVLERVQARSGPLFALLRDTVAVEAGSGHVTVGVPSSFICDRLREQGDGGPLAESLAEVLGAPLRVDYEVSDAPSPARPAEPAPAPTLTDAQRIALIQKELDAELLTETE